MRPRALVVVANGEKCLQFLEVAKPLLEIYAHGVKADVVTYTEPHPRATHRFLDKFYLADALSQYERIWYVDSDTLINPQAPNIFDVIPEKYFGATVVGHLSTIHDNSWKKMVAGLGEIPGFTEKHVFNGGSMLISQDHREIFSFDGSDIKFAIEKVGHFAEQALINYRVRRMGIPFHDLGPQWNATCRTVVPQKRFTSYLLHYVSGGKNKTAFRKGTRLEQMKRDAQILRSNGIIAAGRRRVPCTNRLLDKVDWFLDKLAAMQR